MSIKQVLVGRDNFSYVIYCEDTKKAALVDPGSNASAPMKFIGQNNLDLQYIINTHYHGDHTGDNSRVKETYRCQLIASEADASRISDVDKTVSDGEKLLLGKTELEFMITPGHTPGGLCIIVDNEAIVTGDTLFIGDCGRKLCLFFLSHNKILASTGRDSF